MPILSHIKAIGEARTVKQQSKAKNIKQICLIIRLRFAPNCLTYERGSTLETRRETERVRQVAEASGRDVQGWHSPLESLPEWTTDHPAKHPSKELKTGLVEGVKKQLKLK